MDSTRELKKLNTEKRLLSKRLVDTEQEYKKSKEALNSLKYELTKLNKEIEQLKRKGSLVVSEHALLRLLERKYDISVDEISKEIASPNLIKQVSVLGDGTYPLENGGKAVVKQNVVVTVIN